MINKHAVIPVFIPHKGCPHDCIFCNQRKISAQDDEMSADKMNEIIQAHLKTITPGTNIEIGFYGGSFTGIDRSLQFEFLAAANEYVKSGRVTQIRLSTRPDYINSEILEYLKLFNVGTIELGVQSMDDGILKASCRGHNADDVYKSSLLVKEYGFKLGIQTMIGLPGDSREKDIFTAKKVIEIRPSIVRIYPVLVIRGTYLEKLLLDGSYNPLGLDDAVDICAELLEMYESSNINVIRIGLQQSDNIREGHEVAAGPVHPAFRQLVESRLALRKIEECIIRQELKGAGGIIILTGSSNISNVIGQRKCNIDYISKKYSIGSVKVKESGKYCREIHINCTKS